MTPHDAKTTLDRLWDDVPVGTPPIGALVRGGKTMRRRARLRAAGGAAALILAVVAGSTVAANTVFDSANPRPDGEVPSAVEPPTAPADQTKLSRDELARASALARQKVESEDAAVTSATVTAEQGTEEDTNTGYACSSGRLLHIKLIGRFPHIVTSGGPIDATKPGPTPDFTVRAVVLTADAESGMACQVSVQTGEVSPEPGATVLRLD